MKHEAKILFTNQRPPAEHVSTAISRSLPIPPALLVVADLQTLFQRKGVRLPVTNNPNDYVARDIVSWILSGNLPHIGIVIDSNAEGGSKPLIVHNIGSGPVVEDILFEFEITGHYRYYGSLNNR